MRKTTYTYNRILISMCISVTYMMPSIIIYKFFHIDDSTSKDSLAANIKGTVGEDGIEKYLEIGALLLLITGASYSTGKYIGSRKKN